MVDNVVRSKAQAINSTCGVEDTWNSCAQIDVLADAFHSRCVMEVGAADCLPDYIPVHTRALLFHAHALHDIHQLRPDFSNFLERLGVNEVFLGPLCVVLVHLPLLVHVQ